MVLYSVERGVAVALSVGGGEALHVVDWLEQVEVEQGTSAATATTGIVYTLLDMSAMEDGIAGAVLRVQCGGKVDFGETSSLYNPLVKPALNQDVLGNFVLNIAT